MKLGLEDGTFSRRLYHRSFGKASEAKLHRLGSISIGWHPSLDLQLTMPSFRGTLNHKSRAWMHSGFKLAVNGLTTHADYFN